MARSAREKEKADGKRAKTSIKNALVNAPHNVPVLIPRMKDEYQWGVVTPGIATLTDLGGWNFDEYVDVAKKAGLLNHHGVGIRVSNRESVLGPLKEQCTSHLVKFHVEERQCRTPRHKYYFAYRNYDNGDGWASIVGTLPQKPSIRPLTSGIDSNTTIVIPDDEMTNSTPQRVSAPRSGVYFLASPSDDLGGSFDCIVQPAIVSPSESTATTTGAPPRPLLLGEHEDDDDGYDDGDDDDCDDDNNKNRVNNYVPLSLDEAQALNFDTSPRPPRRRGGKVIMVRKHKWPDAKTRLLIVFVARVHLNIQGATDRAVVVEAACRLVAYDCGFPKPFKGSKFDEWEQQLMVDGIQQGFGYNLLETMKMGPKLGTYTDRVEAAHPGWLHSCFRWSTKKYGDEATWQELAKGMNEASKALMADEEQSTDHQSSRDHDDSRAEEEGETPCGVALSMNRESLRLWFHQHQGTLKRKQSKPILTDDRRKDRMKWCEERRAENHAGSRHRAFLDEKWFYLHSKRKKSKYLPLGALERKGDDAVPMRRTMSRRHATKVMYLGVIAKPDPDNDFSGKIFIKRVAQDVQYDRKTFKLQFSDEAATNGTIKATWRQKAKIAVMPESDSEWVLDHLRDVFEFSEEAESRLVLRYKSFGKTGRAQTAKEYVWPPETALKDLKVYDAQGSAGRPLQLNDLELAVMYHRGNTRTEDVSCDSEFMMDVMEPIGKAIRDSFHWVPRTVEIDLIMDNAGGHGRKDIVEEYRDLLKQRFNVRIVHQVPRSPATNLLDLGAWASLQSAVEKAHRGRVSDANALARTIERVWELFDWSVFKKIYERWVRVLDLIIIDKGDNKLEDEKRKALLYPLDEEVDRVLSIGWHLDEGEDQQEDTEDDYEV